MEQKVIQVMPFPKLDWKEIGDTKKEVTEENINYWEEQISLSALYGEEEISVPAEIYSIYVERLRNYWTGMLPKDEEPNIDKFMEVTKQFISMVRRKKPKNMVNRLKNRKK